jgi:hypothetical protein
VSTCIFLVLILVLLVSSKKQRIKFTSMLEDLFMKIDASHIIGALSCNDVHICIVAEEND